MERSIPKCEMEMSACDQILAMMRPMRGQESEVVYFLPHTRFLSLHFRGWGGIMEITGDQSKKEVFFMDSYQSCLSMCYEKR